MRNAVGTPALRTLASGDLARLGELSERLGAETASDWSRRVARDGVVIVGAEIDGSLVGYAAGEVRRSFGRAATAWIDAFGVDPHQRGHGFGRALLTALLARLRERGARHVFTLVPFHDRTIGPFFRELGFREEPFTPLGREL